MASLVTALVADHAAAASGSVEFYSMGTATLSSLVYSDPNGVKAVTTHTLDANGCIARYVGEPVDVLIYNAAGARVYPQFSHIDDGRLVRVETSPFSGPNASGQTVVGGRTTATAALAQTSITGTTIASGSLQVFNVLSYGASTSASSNDSAFAAAVAAANAVGGGRVYAPAGTYKFTSARNINLNSASKVSIVGDGIDVTVLKNMSTSATCIDVSPAVLADVNCEISNLSISANTTTSGNGIRVGLAARVWIHHVKVSGHTDGIIFNGAGTPASYAIVEHCQVSLSGISTTDGAFYCGNSNVVFRDCYATGGAAAGVDYGFRTLAGSYITFDNCTATAMTTGTARGIFVSNANTNVTIMGCNGSGNDADCEIQAPGGTSATAIQLIGNQFATLIDNSGTGAETGAPRAIASSTSSGAATFTVTPDFTTVTSLPTVTFHIVGSYTVGAQGGTIANPTNLANIPIGTILEFTIMKTGANNLNLTWGANYLDIDASTAFGGMASVTSANHRSVRFIKNSGGNLLAISVTPNTAN